jgi:copper chaperone
MNRYVENIVKFLIALMLVIASLATNAFAGKVEYELKVEGMKCAYCAYNVSKQLESLDGVVPRSVDVDLEQGRVTLRSERELEDARLAAVLLEAGFTLGTVTNSVAVVSQLQQRSDQAVLLRLIMQSDRISDGEFDAVLEALGDLAAEQSGQISVVGPGELEDAILKPVLAGRSTVIKVDFDRTNRPGQTVVVSLSAPSTKSR